jgi:hypothetical protein
MIPAREEIAFLDVYCYEGTEPPFDYGARQRLLAEVRALKVVSSLRTATPSCRAHVASATQGG